MPVERVLNQFTAPSKPLEERYSIAQMFHSRANMNKFNSKLKSMVTDLNQTVAGEIDKNNKLNQNINQLRKALDMEKKRTMDVDQRLRDEFKEFKKSENEKIEHHEKISQRLNEIKMEIGEGRGRVIGRTVGGKQDDSEGGLGQIGIRK
jgi:predicted RNase H-like nuclease (RuvC/YqgF family)